MEVDGKKELSMTINYSANHTLFSLEIFTEEKLTTTQRMVTWLVLSQIAHFTKHVGQCSFNKNQMAADLGCHHKFMKEATDLLIKHDLIKEIQPARKAQGKPAHYVTTKRYGSLNQKDRHRGSRAMAQGDQDNNINNYNQKDDGLNKPHPSSKKEKGLSREEHEKRIIEEWMKQNKNTR